MRTTIYRDMFAALGLILAVTTVSNNAAMAVVPLSTSAINTDEASIAVHGYDTVSYFTDGKPAKGNPRFSVTHEGARYFFANASNMKKFTANPETFVPQFGGFCAMGVALEKKLDGDPTVWKIVDGKLYLNVNKDVSVAWQRDIPGNLSQANENWPEIKDKTPASLG